MGPLYSPNASLGQDPINYRTGSGEEGGAGSELTSEVKGRASQPRAGLSVLFSSTLWEADWVDLPASLSSHHFLLSRSLLFLPLIWWLWEHTKLCRPGPCCHRVVGLERWLRG